MEAVLYPRRWTRRPVRAARTPQRPRRWVMLPGRASGAQERLGAWRAKVDFLRGFLP